MIVIGLIVLGVLALFLLSRVWIGFALFGTGIVALMLFQDVPTV